MGLGCSVYVVFGCHVAVRVPMCLDSSPDVERQDQGMMHDSCSGMEETRIQEVLGSITSQAYASLTVSYVGTVRVQFLFFVFLFAQRWKEWKWEVRNWGYGELFILL